MPRPQIYVGYFPKTEKCSNEDILQLLEGQNSALRIGDWRTLNRVERGKHVELTLSVDPVSDDLLKSQGYTLCYGFGLVNVRPKNRHSVGVKDTAAEPEPGTASTTQVQEASQELPCCSNSIAPSSNTPEEEKEKAGGSTWVHRRVPRLPKWSDQQPMPHSSPGCALHCTVGSQPNLGKAPGGLKRRLCCLAATGVRRGPLDVGEGTDGPLHPQSKSFTGLIPSKWTEVKVVFIPKAGKKSAQLPKSYRPIILSSFFLNTMEKIIDHHIRDENLKHHPLYKYQFAYQAGKSTETAIHCLTTTIEKAIAAQQIVLEAFIDISGAFDNTSYEAIHKALINKGVSPMIWGSKKHQL
ncbi:hypothetical protein ACLKA6_017611 [Drosophila palustris]